MKRREFLIATGSSLFSAAVLPYRTAFAARRRKKRVLYFTRNVGYYHSVVQRKGDELSHSEQVLVRLGNEMGVEIECTKDGRVFDQDLAPFDAIAFYTNEDLTQPNPQNEPPMSAAGKQRLLDAVEQGTGFFAFHSSCNSWHTPGERYVNNDQVDPYIAMLGGEFIAHGAQQEATMAVASPEFPGMQDLGQRFRMFEEWYALKNFASDLHVILVQKTAGMDGPCYQRPDFPSTWARLHGKGRVFFTSLAHREDTWSDAHFHQIVRGGLSWVLRDVDADVMPNIDQVTPQARQLRV